MSRRLVSFAAALTVSVTAMAGAGAALALAVPAPAWNVSSVSYPTDLRPGGTGGMIVVHVENVGDAASEGTVTVVDKLPPGIEATKTGAVQYGGVHGGAFISGVWDCTGTSVVTCTNDPLGLPVIEPGSAAPETLDWVPSIKSPFPLGIEVSVAGSARERSENVVSVSGGGASRVATDSQPVTVSATPALPGLESFHVASLNKDGSPDVQAGSHPYEMMTSFVFNNIEGEENYNRPVGQGLKDLEVDLPVGLSGDPTATPRCPRSDFDVYLIAENNPTNRPPGAYNGVPFCSADTQVGTITITLAGIGALSYPVYNIEPPAGVPAQFGFAVLERAGLIDVGVRTGAGYGLKVVSKNIVQTSVLGVSFTLWGVPGDPSHNPQRCEQLPCNGWAEGAHPRPANGLGMKPLLTQAPSCGVPLAWSVSGDTWEEPGNIFSSAYPATDNEGNQISLQGCELLGWQGFKPTLSVTPESSITGSPTGLNVDVGLPQNELSGGLAEPDLQSAVVTLPAGMTISPSAAVGLQACTPEEIGLENANPPSCPDASKVGAVEAHSPALEAPLVGSAYVAQQANNPFGSLLALYLVVEGGGVLVKVAGEVHLDPVTGQITTSFKNLPQQPVSDIKLHFFGGPNAALVTPSACGSYTATGVFSPSSGQAPAEPFSIFAIDQGCGAQGFNPSFTAGMSNNQAGAFSPLGVTFSRQDSEQDLGGITVTTPPGLLAILKSVVQCPEPQASLGTCGPQSLIGHTTVTAGPGSDPVVVQGGQVSLTGPYKGAPFGLSIVVPAAAGPFNLGTQIVRAAINIDPHTAQATITSDPLPSILQGIPLQIKTVNVSVDRPGFTFNPTDCEPLNVNGTLTSTQGASAGVSSHFQAANCANLPFHPSFTVATQAKTSKKAGASLDVKVGSSAGQANIGKVAVSLPKQLPSRLTTIQQACTAAVFDQNPAGCPAGSDIGVATALTPVLAGPLTGPAYLVSHGGAAFPDVVVILQGEGITLDLTGSVNIKGGVTSSAFDAVPDAPISSFELSLPEGPHSALATNLPGSAKGSLCGQSLVMPTTIIGQNGAVIKQSTKIAVSGCPKTKKAKAHKKHRKAKGKGRAKGKGGRKKG